MPQPKFREQLTRLNIVLPAPLLLSDFYLVNNLVDDLVSFCGGATSTLAIPPVINGIWYDHNLGHTVDDLNMLVIADTPLSIDDPDLASFLEDLKFVAQIDFQQDLIWLTLHSIQRVTIADP